MPTKIPRERGRVKWPEAPFEGHILTIKMRSGRFAAKPERGDFVDHPNTDIIQGTLDMLILKTLSLEPLHGFGIARRIEQISRGVFKVNPGLPPHRLPAPGAGGLARGRVAETDNRGGPSSTALTRAAGNSSTSKRPAGRAGSWP